MTRGKFWLRRTYSVSFRAGSGTHVQRSGSCWSDHRAKELLISRMESVRPLIVPGPFLLESFTPVFDSWCLVNAVDPVNCPVGSLLEFLQHKFRLERPLPPWESMLQLSLLEGTRTMSPWVDIVWCPPLCVGLSAWGRFVLLVSLLGTFMWPWRGC